MLVLTRQSGERIRIRTPDGHTIWIKLIDISGNRIKIGIDAAKEIKIVREEVLEEKDQNKGS